jgi:hypothetical protein
MPRLVVCESCGKKLRIPDGSTAAKARCPGCGEVVALTETGITSTPPASPPREERKRRPTPDPDGITQDAPLDDDEPRPRKKKRKRSNKSKKETTGVPLWVWGALAGAFLLLVGIVCAVFIHSGHGAELIGFVLVMAILLPVSVVILVISMFLSSFFLGGVDFGQAHIAIPKAGALLFVVTLISMIPFAGPLLALAVWFLGLMGLFGLDFVEARILVIINWGLNTLVRYLVLAAILSSGGGLHDDQRKNRLPQDEDAALSKPVLVASLDPSLKSLSQKGAFYPSRDR